MTTPQSAPRYAVQSLKVVDGGSRDVIVRRAYCQDHGQWSSHFQGVDEQGWLFRCASSRLHMSHLFHVHPPVGVPTKDLAAVQEWMQAQRLAYAAKSSGKDKGQ